MTINYQLSIINYQLSIINYQLSIINYSLHPVSTRKIINDLSTVMVGCAELLLKLWRKLHQTRL